MHAWSLPGSPCPSIAPRAKSLASVMTINSFDKSGPRNTGSLQSASHSSSKACCCSSPHMNGCFPMSSFSLNSFES